MQTIEINQRSKFLKTGFVIVLLLVFVLLINNYLLGSELKLSVDGLNNQSQIKVFVSGLDGTRVTESQLNSAQTKSIRLPAGEFNVSASQEDSESMAFVKIQRFKSNHLQLKLVPQQALNKLGSESLGCDALKNSVLYSYSCTKSSVILRHENPPDRFVNPTPLLSAELTLPTPLPYMGGLLAKFGDFESTYLNFVDLASSQTKLIKTVETLDIESTQVITDGANSQTNERFLLVGEDGKIYSYANFNDNQPQIIQLPDTPQNNLLAKKYILINNRLMVYVGKDETGGEDEAANKARAELKNNYLYIAELNQPTPTFNSINIASSLTTKELHFIDDSHFAVVNNSGVAIYEIVSNSIKLVGSFADVNYSYPGPNSSLWLIKNNALYKYAVSSNQAVKVFGSAHLELSRVVTIANDVLINAFVQNDKSSVLHSYQVGAKPASYPRLEDKLPYLSENSTPVLKMDYSGSSLKIQLALTSLSSDRQTGRVSYDQSEFNSAKEKVLKQLEADGFDLQKLQIVFSL